MRWSLTVTTRLCVVGFLCAATGAWLTFRSASEGSASGSPAPVPNRSQLRPHDDESRASGKVRRSPGNPQRGMARSMASILRASPSSEGRCADLADLSQLSVEELQDLLKALSAELDGMPSHDQYECYRAVLRSMRELDPAAALAALVSLKDDFLKSGIMGVVVSDYFGSIPASAREATLVWMKEHSAELQIGLPNQGGLTVYRIAAAGVVDQIEKEDLEAGFSTAEELGFPRYFAVLEAAKNRTDPQDWSRIMAEMRTGKDSSPPPALARNGWT